MKHQAITFFHHRFFIHEFFILIPSIEFSQYSRRMTRKHVLSANTQFTCAQFFPTGVQILATGSDRKISFWEVFDGSLVRHVEGSSKGCINWLSINSSGEMFASCGDDQMIKVTFTLS